MSTIVTIRRPLVGVVLGVLLGACAASGGQPTSSPVPTATPVATDEPTPSPISALPLSFTSTLNGISASYPEGWTAQAATEPWTQATFPLSFEAPQVDWLYDSDLRAGLFLAIASQPIGDSTPEDWVSGQMASEEGCTSALPIDLDGATGLIGAGHCTVAAVATAGRGYWIQLYTGDDAPIAYDRAWFKEVLATVQLHPESAVSP